MKNNNKNVLSFMPVGHTKFACDWAFRLLKKKFRVSYVSSSSDLVDCIEKSSPKTNVSSAVMVANEKGEVFVPLHNWLNFPHNNDTTKLPLNNKIQLL